MVPSGTFGSVNKGERFFTPLRSAADLAKAIESELEVGDTGSFELEGDKSIMRTFSYRGKR